MVTLPLHRGGHSQVRGRISCALLLVAHNEAGIVTLVAPSRSRADGCRAGAPCARTGSRSLRCTEPFVASGPSCGSGETTLPHATGPRSRTSLRPGSRLLVVLKPVA